MNLLLAQDSVTGWEQHGLAGLVIGSLFLALLFVARWLLAHIDRINEQYIKERSEFLRTIDGIAERHYQERKEWRMEASVRDANIEKAIGRFTEVLTQVQREYAIGLAARGKNEI